jgi:hypothetical protein
VYEYLLELEKTEVRLIGELRAMGIKMEVMKMSRLKRNEWSRRASRRFRLLF